MKKLSALLISIILIFSHLNLAFASTKEANVKVKGLVCAFCVKNIEKSFLKNDATQSVKVNLDTKIVTLNFKDNQDISDEEINKIITNAGFNVTSIER